MHALITGASSGLGEAMARHFAAAGWSLTLVARRKATLDALANEFQTPTHVIGADLSNLDRAVEVIAESQQALGPIDALINNAGVQYVEPTAGISHERSELLFKVNLLAPMRLIHEVLPTMLERRSGTIVNISSMAGITPTPGMCHYNASKAGLAAASESLRVELADSGVHILTVYPGPVTTPMETAARDSFTPHWAVRNVPTGTPEGMAKLVLSGILKKTPRIFYPRVYGMARHTRVLSQWVTDTFAPPLKDE